MISPADGKKLADKLAICSDNEKKLKIIAAERDELGNQGKLKDEKIENLDLNIVELKNETAGFKKAYIEEVDKYNKLQENVPSRMTWFGLGAGATAILGIVFAFLVAK